MQQPNLSPFPPVLVSLFYGLSDLPGSRVLFHCGPNDSGITRGDREDTGDNEARPTEKGSGSAQPTIDPTAFGGESSIGHPSGAPFDLGEELEDTDGMEVMEANDGRLGLTNTDRVPADDWAADTGGTKNPDGVE